MYEADNIRAPVWKNYKHLPFTLNDNLALRYRVVASIFAVPTDNLRQKIRILLFTMKSILLDHVSRAPVCQN
jgi:hypothetical protein